MDKTPAISFDNTEYAFAYKKDSELKKAHLLFNVMGKPWLVNMGLKLTPLAIKWRIPFTNLVIRNTIFGNLSVAKLWSKRLLLQRP